MSNLTIGIESKSLTIECNARGKPQPVIYWARSGQASGAPSKSSDSSASAGSSSGAVAPGQEDFLILEDGNLFIERLSKRYEGTYLCQASNEHGSVDVKTYLQVKPVPSRPPPLVIYGPQNQTVAVNTQVTLDCLTSLAANVLFGAGDTEEVSSDERSSPPQQQMAAGGGSSMFDSEKIFITWFKGSQQLNVQAHYDETGKYRLLESGSLEINSAQK